MHNFKVLALTFWAFCEGKLLAGINRIVIKVFPPVLLNKNLNFAGGFVKKSFEV